MGWSIFDRHRVISIEPSATRPCGARLARICRDRSSGERLRLTLPGSTANVTLSRGSSTPAPSSARESASTCWAIAPVRTGSRTLYETFDGSDTTSVRRGSLFFRRHQTEGPARCCTRSSSPRLSSSSPSRATRPRSSHSRSRRSTASLPPSRRHALGSQLRPGSRSSPRRTAPGCAGQRCRPQAPRTSATSAAK